MTTPIGPATNQLSIPLGEGNHQVKLEVHAPPGSKAFVWVQGHRLAAISGPGSPGPVRQLAFAVNLRNPGLPKPSEFEPGGAGVILHPVESKHSRWSTTLEIRLTPDTARLQKLEIVPAPELPTIYLAGDSTVCDQLGGSCASWGQMLPAFFSESVAIANHAESGETLKSFITGLRLAKILTTLGHGDWLFIQFAHNDQKTGRPAVYADPELVFPAYLAVLCAEAQARGAKPVVFTPVERRNFDPQGRIIPSHGDYPDAIRRFASRHNLPLVDLHRASIALYERLGPDQAAKAFADEGRDRSHHNVYGAYQLAGLVADRLRAVAPDLAAHLQAPNPIFQTPQEFLLPVPGSPATPSTILGN